MRDDTKDILKQYGISVFRYKKLTEDAERLIRNDEHLVYIEPTWIEVVVKSSGKYKKYFGVIYVTDRRLNFYSKSEEASILNIFLNDIEAITAIPGKIRHSSICLNTPKLNLKFFIRHRENTVASVRNIISLLSKAIKECDFTGRKSSYFDFENDNSAIMQQEKYIGECPGCGAINIVPQNEIVRCSFCNRYINSL